MTTRSLFTTAPVIPYITLERAKELHRIEVKFGHLGRIKEWQER